MTLAEMLASASDEDKAALRTLLAADAATTTTTPVTEPSTVGETAPVVELVAASTYARGSAMGDVLIDRVVETAGLKAVRQDITEFLPERFTEADLKNAVSTVQRFLEGIEKRGLRPTVPHVQLGEEDMDKRLSRLDRTLEGNYKDGYVSWRQIARDFLAGTDLDLFGSDDFAQALIQEAHRGAPSVGNAGRIARARESADAARITEAISVATFGEILGDSVTRSLLRIYGASPFTNWQAWTSIGAPLNDFRTRRVTRLGGYANLPTVAENAAYTALTSPTDEEATYTLVKRGGTETLSMESIANDDLGALQRIPQELANAAAQTLHDFVWNFLVGNGNIYDGVALFAVGHNNTAATSPLSAATLNVARKAMEQQSRYGAASQRLAIAPRFLLVPSDLRDTAFRLTQSGVAVTTNANATEPNINTDLTHIVDPWLSDTNDWFLVADPALVPTIELAFYRGREEPELFVQDMTNVGSMFTNDQLTYKIRHVYSGAALDFRGLYRGQG